MAIDNNAVYCDSKVVDHYAKATHLLPPEKYLFEKYIHVGQDVLDIGVGGGRTTQFLYPRAGKYVGIDYAKAMVDFCRIKFPDVTFIHADATDLSMIEDAQFDVAVFSFNGLDYIDTDAGRISCLREMARVTRPEGHIIVSSHNAKAVGVYPVLEGVSALKKIWRLVRAVEVSLRLAARTIPTAAYRAGRGYLVDPVHGNGLLTHVSTPESIAADAEAAGLRVVERADGFHPKRVPEWLNPWHTYVLAPR